MKTFGTTTKNPFLHILTCPIDLIKLEITEKAQIFGLKFHSEKR